MTSSTEFSTSRKTGQARGRQAVGGAADHVHVATPRSTHPSRASTSHEDPDPRPTRPRAWALPPGWLVAACALAPLLIAGCGDMNACDHPPVGVGAVVTDVEMEELNRRRKELPERVPLSTVGERHTLLLQQKAIIDRIKITAYNAEEMLLELLAMHYPNLHDIRDLLRAFCQISGQLRATRQGVQITLDPPDNPTHRRALRGLCADLNQLAPTYPGTDLPLRYDVGVHHAEAAA